VGKLGTATVRPEELLVGQALARTPLRG